MGICGQLGCGCAIQSTSLQISGSGAAGDPWNIESNGISICTSTTRPGSPFLGQVIFETDTQRTYLWNGSAWKIQHDPGADAWIGMGFGGNTDTTASDVTWTNWFDPADPVAPPWATAALIDAAITNVGIDTAATDLFMGIRIQLDSLNGGERIFKIAADQATTMIYQERFTGLTSDGIAAMPIMVQAKAVFAGTAKARVNIFSIASFQIHWQEV